MTIKHNNLGTVNKNEVILRKETRDGQHEVTLKLTFSYETCVGVLFYGNDTTINAVHENDWSTTTGKLLNQLEPNKKLRVNATEFAKQLGWAVAEFEKA